MDYTIFYPTPLTEIDPLDGNLDVCVTFADGQSCTFVFTTPQNLITQMKGEGRGGPIWSRDFRSCSFRS